MIVLSEERYVPAYPGYMTLQDVDGIYYYIHRSLYDQSVIMEDRYGDNVETLVKLIGGNPDNIAIQKFVTYVPRPVNIMGYFLALLEEDIVDFTDAVGALDVIATAINLRKLIKQPEEIRQSVSFGMSIENEYQDAWNHFFEVSYKYGESPTTGRAVTTTYSAPAVEEDISEEELVSSFESSLAEALAEADRKYLEGEDESEEEQPKAQSIPASLGGDGMSAIAKHRRAKL